MTRALRITQTFFSEQDQQKIEGLAKHVIHLSDEDALNFAANAISIPDKKTIIVNSSYEFRKDDLRSLKKALSYYWKN